MKTTLKLILNPHFITNSCGYPHFFTELKSLVYQQLSSKRTNWRFKLLRELVLLKEIEVKLSTSKVIHNFSRTLERYKISQGYPQNFVFFNRKINQFFPRPKSFFLSYPQKFTNTSTLKKHTQNSWFCPKILTGIFP